MNKNLRIGLTLLKIIAALLIWVYALNMAMMETSGWQYLILRQCQEGFVKDLHNTACVTPDVLSRQLLFQQLIWPCFAILSLIYWFIVYKHIIKPKISAK